MAVKGKITRLNDPSNPYTKKVSAAEARASAAAQPKQPPPPPMARKKPTIAATARAAAADVAAAPGRAMTSARAGYAERQNQRIDSAVNRAEGRRAK